MFNVYELVTLLEDKPILKIHVNGQPMTMLCDTGACKTVLNQKPKNLKFSKDTLTVKSASGHTSVKSLTEGLLLVHKESGRSCKNQCIYDPSCPANLLGRDSMEKLKIGVVPGSQGMHAELMLNYEEAEEEGQINYSSEGEGVPHYYWTLDLPPLEPLQRLAEKYLPPDSRPLAFDEYHNTLRFKQSPGPDPSYDTQIHRLGPQKLTLQHLYVTKSGNAVCSVIQTGRVQEMNRMSKPHVSVARNENTDWRELGHVLTQVERDRYEKTEETHEGWLQGRRTGCMRYTLGWVLTTQPATHLSDCADTHMSDTNNE